MHAFLKKGFIDYMDINVLSSVTLGALSQGILWGIMGLGVYISFRILDIADLSVEGSFATGAAIVGMMCVQHNISPVIGCLVALIGGAIAGAVTGVLHTKCRIPAILAGILTQLGLYSVNLRIMGSANIPFLRVDTVFSLFTDLFGLDRTTSSIILGLIIVIIVIALIYYFFGTELGSAIRATGCNLKMVRAQGIDTDKMIIIGLAISNALVAFSGALVAQSQGYADVKLGQGAIVIGLAAIIIGEVLLSIFSKKASFVSKFAFVIVGSFIYRLIVALVLQMGLNTDDLKLFTAILVAIALSIPSLMAHNNLKKTYKANMKGLK